MKRKMLPILLVLAIQTPAIASDLTFRPTGTVNYEWMNRIVNKTPVSSEVCPVLEVDTYRDGFRVSLEKSFYANVGVSMAKWFPNVSMWGSVGVAPVYTKFGIYNTEASNLSEIRAAKKVKLPNTTEELSVWKVKDSAYWESQGGISLYVGAGYGPLSAGVFAIATGGWTNYLQKTAENKVYVERARKYIQSVNVGAGIFLDS